MKKSLIYFVVVLMLMLLAVFAYKQRQYVADFLKKKEGSSMVLNASAPVLAEFSFHANAQNRVIAEFPHFTVKLFESGRWKINRNLLDQIPDSIPVLITVETWNRNRISSYFESPLEKLEKGSYDKVFKRLCTEIIRTRPNVYFRLNPEMEVPVTRYPWQYSGPRFIESFRHFAEVCKIHAPQVKQVWGPAGYPGTLELYPGDDVVDAASVTIKSDSEQLLDVYPKNYPVQYDVMRRLHRLRFIDKPVFVLGSHQSPNDSVNMQLVSDITNLINGERDVVYSENNFQRHEKIVTERKSGEIEIGLYDPQSLLNKEPAVTVEHLFVDFGSLENGEFEKDFHDVIGRDHDVIVTFEPFRLPGGKTDLQVLENITDGKYDTEINKLYSIVSAVNRRVYLRYGHEMEIPITRYPWQSQNPVVYIKSFRYLMTFKNPFPANIKRVWGPAGDRGSIEWYPGDDVVDFMSIAIYGLPDKNITDPEKQESFSTIFYRKYWRLRFIDKPLFITEFGVKGPEEYQTKWLENAAKVIRENHQVVGINYFNMSDTPKAWGDIKPPDWSITLNSFNRFVSILKEQE
jgi:beta-mannanase